MSAPSNVIFFSRHDASRPSQANHFAHQARPLFEDPSRRAQAIAFLNERTQQRIGALLVWDFPDGSAVQINATGQLIVAQEAPNLMARWTQAAMTLLFKRSVPM